MNQFFLNQSVSDRLLFVTRQRPQIVECQLHGQPGRYDLHVSTVDMGEGCAQNFVAPDDFVNAPLEDGYVARRCQSERIEDIEKRYVGQRVL